ncbi:MAG: proton-conducting transporter membrane subunit [Thermoguttaceae bacterium]
MNPCALLLGLFAMLCGAGVVLTAILPQKRTPQALAFVGTLASLALIGASSWILMTGNAFALRLWAVPPFGTLLLQMDRLSALFSLITGLVFLPVSVFCAGSLPRYLGRYSLRAFAVMYLALYASIVLILTAGDVLLLLLAWEVMSILTYLLVNYEHEEPAHTRAGYVMLAFGEAGTLAAALGLLVLAIAAGSLDFASLKAAAPALGHGARWAVFLLTFFGFGVKAGLVPVNSWLPRAYAAAPSSFLPVLAGALLNLGFYGMMRFNADLAPLPFPAPGLVVLIVGTVSAFLGILYATTENDLKVMLAHSSIENAGIITVALGAGFVFTAYHLSACAAIAFVAAAYHMTNHSFYKTLLLLGAGAVEEQAGTRDLDKLGGLIRTMPWAALLFLCGAMSIAALPPFNGFVSEWLTLQTVLRSAELPTVGVKITFAICGAGLALTAALAVTCFVKAFAMGFLGMSRSAQAERAREARRSALVPMAMLSVLCLGLGVLPTYVIPLLGRAVTPMPESAAAEALVPPFFAGSPDHERLPAEFAAEFHDLGAQVGQSVMPGRGLVVLHRGGKQNPVVFAMSTSYMAIVLVVLLGVLYGVMKFVFTRRREAVRRACWDGGVRRLLPEMTYSATGFSNPVRVIFDAIFHPTTIENEPRTVAAHFRTAIHRQRREVHIVDRFFLRPAMNMAWGLAKLLAGMHNGKLNAYLAYVLLALLLVLLAAWALTTGA